MRLWRSRPDFYFLFLIFYLLIAEPIYSLPCGEGRGGDIPMRGGDARRDYDFKTKGHLPGANLDRFFCLVWSIAEAVFEGC